MSNVVCSQCGAPLDPGAIECKFCGEKIVVQQINQQMSPQMNPQMYQQMNPQMNQQMYQQMNPQMNQQMQMNPQMNPQMYQQMSPQQYQYGVSQQPQTFYAVQQPQPIYVTAIDPRWPVKSKITAGVLGILLGGLGIHKFYLGKIGMGLIYLLFFWTYIPAIAGIIEGIVYLCSSDENFQIKNHVRIR